MEEIVWVFESESKMSMKEKILIVVPSFKILGGVASHYMGLAPYWKTDVRYCFYGRRKHLPAVVCLIPDLIIYVFRLVFGRYKVVVVNPSLRNYQLARDAVYLCIARLFGRKVVTFIHGWDDKVADKIQQNPRRFQKTYGKSMFIYVLCSDFKHRLDTLGLEAPVVLTSTKVSDELVDGFERHHTGKINNILFLARVHRLKGIFITIDAFKILKEKNPNIRLSVCGSGPDMEEAKQYVENSKLSDVVFYGGVSGEKLIESFKDGDLYILPTYGEGMATSVLEAMAFGLPIVSRSVGGVKDFFVNGEMGYLTESLEPKDYAEIIQSLIDNPEQVKKMSKTVETYAKEHFLASMVAEKYERDIESNFI